MSTNSLAGVKKIVQRKNNIAGNSCHAEIGTIKSYLSTYHKHRKCHDNLTLYSVAFKLTCDDEGNIVSMYMSNAKPCKKCSHTITNCKIDFRTVIYSNDFNNINVQNNFTKTRIRSTCRDYININLNAYLLKSSYKNYKLYTYYSKKCTLINVDRKVLKNEINNNKYIVLPYDVYFREISKNSLLVIELSSKAKVRVQIKNTTVGTSVKALCKYIKTNNVKSKFAKSTKSAKLNCAFIENTSKHCINNYSRNIIEKSFDQYVLVEYEKY